MKNLQRLVLQKQHPRLALSRCHPLGCLHLLSQLTENLFRRLLRNLVLSQVRLFRHHQGLLAREQQVNQQVPLLDAELVLPEAVQRDPALHLVARRDLVLLLVAQEDAQMIVAVQEDAQEVAAAVRSNVEDVNRSGVDGRSRSCSLNKLLLILLLMLRCLKGKY
jgi:hypothetical protein|tara:strand:+ start:511 stop:1002 length:492 start_codon:yes stop_codon:yes gene_type:complete